MEKAEYFESSIPSAFVKENKIFEQQGQIYALEKQIQELRHQADQQKTWDKMRMQVKDDTIKAQRTLIEKYEERDGMSRKDA